jgi:hypothetical protein
MTTNTIIAIIVKERMSENPFRFLDVGVVLDMRWLYLT